MDTMLEAQRQVRRQHVFLGADGMTSAVGEEEEQVQEEDRSTSLEEDDMPSQRDYPYVLKGGTLPL